MAQETHVRAALSPEFLEGLTKRFTTALRAELTPEEAAFLDEIPPPVIEVSTLDAESCIKISGLRLCIPDRLGGQ